MTVQHNIFLALSFCILPALAFGSQEELFQNNQNTNARKGTEQSCFDKKDESFWVIKDRNSFITATQNLISEGGEWLGSSSIPQYVKYTGELKKEDIPLLEKWLKIKDLKCIGLADQKKQGPIQIIDAWHDELLQNGIEPEKHGAYKIAWLNYNSMLRQLELADCADLPSQWVETNRDYLMKNSHYRDYSSPPQLSW